MEMKVGSLGTVYLLSSVRSRKIRGGEARSWRIGVHVLIFITEGEAVARLDGALCKIRPLGLYLLVPGMIVEFPEQVNGFSYYAVFFYPIEMVKAHGEIKAASRLSLTGGLLPGKITTSLPQQSLQTILRLAELDKERSEQSRFLARLALEQWMQKLIYSSDALSQENDERIRRSIQYMERCFMDKISVSELAAEAGMTSAAYSAQFRKVMGQAPVEYLNEIRINKAKELLRQQHFRVKEAAAAAGFSSEFYFSRMFQRVVGIPPKLYTRKEQPRVAILSSMGFQHYLHALDVKPVYEGDWFHYPGVDAEAYRETFGKRWNALLASEPDLIIVDEYHSEFRDAIKEVAFPVMLDLPVWDWQKNFLKLAGLLHKEETADEALGSLVLRAEQVKQALGEAARQRRVTVLQVNHQTVGILGTTGHPLSQLLYGELGLQPGLPAVVGSWRSEMEPESLPALNSDLMFVYKHHVLAGSEHMYSRMVRTEVWSGIPAVQNGSVHSVNNWFALSWTPAGRLHIMDSLLAAMNG
ncbi:helix-turn-helix domain-containing protein [Paenibacillus sp. CAU 1782]